MGSVIIERAIKKGEKQGYDLGKVQGFDLGKKQGFDLGKEQGENRSTMNTILTVMRKLSMSTDDAMDFLDVSQERRVAILKDPQFISALNQSN